MKKVYSFRTIILAGGLLLQLNTLCFQSRGAAGDVDLSFDPGSGVNGIVYAVAVQSDGKVIIGGAFTMVKGLQRLGIARLNADGSGDSSFDPGTIIGNSGVVFCVTLQPDGKVLVGGGLWTVNGPALNNIARLNADGSLDDTFNPGSGANNFVYSIIPQSDGKLLIGGYFSEINGTSRNGIARLNGNGSLDGSFNPGTGADGGVYAVALQSDGKVLVGGNFTTVNGTGRNGIARLNANGSLNASFNPGTGASGGDVWAVAQAADGRVLIGGLFTAFNGTNRSGLARLNTDGSLDSAFNPGIGAAPTVASILPQADGKIFIGGRFSTVNGTNRNRIARLNVNGSLDESFNSNPGVDDIIHSLVVRADGKVMIGGVFITVDGVLRSRVARLNDDGALDSSFDPGSGIDRFSVIRSVVTQSDGKVIIGGDFTTVKGLGRTNVARLNADGSGDATFNAGTWIDGYVSAIALQSDGKVIFTRGVPGPSGPWPGLTYTAVRLNSDGTVDNSFVPNTGTYVYGSSLTSVVVQPDGKVVLGGYFIEYYVDGEGFIYYYQRALLLRLNTNGSSDTNFASVSGDFDTWIGSVALQSDGKVLVGGWFNNINGTSRNGIARLNSNGSLDGSFNPGTGVGGYPGWVNSVAVQSDGRVLVGGWFDSINGTNRNGIARLNANGSLDGSFNLGTGANGHVASAVSQPDGKVLIGGDFTTVNGTNRNRIARINADGSLDSNFNPGTGADGSIRSVALQSDGNVLIGGNFTTVNGVVRPYVARLYGNSGVPSLSIARSNAFVIVSWPVTDLNFQLQEDTNLFPAAWSPVAQTAVTNAGQISVTVPTAAGRKFFQLKSQ